MTETDACVAAGRRGTRYGYIRGCRCADCTQANTEYHKKLTARLAQTPFGQIPHGLNGYGNYGCRCQVCLDANAAKSRDARNARKARRAAEGPAPMPAGSRAPAPFGQPVEAFGETKPVSDWVLDPRCEITATTLLSRIKRGWPTETALTKPAQHAGPPLQREDGRIVAHPLVRRLRQGRLGAGLTTQVLGELIGVSRLAVTSYEMGRVRVPLGIAAAWAEAVGLRLVLTDTPAGPGAPKSLRTRQQQVLALIAEGCESPEIAQRLGVSLNTIREYRASLLASLGARTSAHAVALGYQLGHLPDRGPQ